MVPAMASTLLTLQTLLRDQGFDAYLVPRADACFGEEVRPHDERLRAVSGFGGSAGLAVIRAGGGHTLLVDGRYAAQARSALAGQDWEVLEGGLDLVAPALAGQRVAYDPWLFSANQLRALTSADLIAHPDNLVDAAWADRPHFASAGPYDLSMQLAGETAEDKRTRMAAACAGRSLLITQPDALAWLTNTRGSDLPSTPVCVQFGLLRPDATVETYSPEHRAGLLAALKTDETVQYDPATTSQALVAALGTRGQAHACPIQQAKATKNAAEIAAMRAAHQHDAQALGAFLDWFDVQDKTKLTELDLVAKLADCRARNPAYLGPSFETICGAGPNGALPHYRVSAATNRRLHNGDLIVLDSGGQYPGATTDVTRTLSVGTVSEDRRQHFTLVLKGLITLTRQQFPVGTTGHQLDVLARAALWNAGLNYNHGTGHGVGAGLGVHESPPNLSPRPRTPAADWALRPGMVFSNEPGFYAEGSHGIRCENLLLVVERAPGWLGFETLTQVPFDPHLIVWDLLSDSESDWLRAYQEEGAIS